MQKLEGGFINDPRRDGSSVIKTYGGEELVHISSGERQRREELALKNFGEAGIAPRLYESDRTHQTITMEYVPSVPLLDDYVRRDHVNRNGILKGAGDILRQVHRQVDWDIDDYLSHYFIKSANATNKAYKILEYAGLKPTEVFKSITSAINPDEVQRHGITYTHGDPWLNNFLYNDKQDRVLGMVDWEAAGEGSPFEDFAIVYLWIEKEHGNIDAFWDGYGSRPERNTLYGFVIAKCIEFIARTDLNSFMKEQKDGGGYYTNKIEVIKETLKELQRNII